MKKEPIIIYKSGSNMWEKVGSNKVNLEYIIKLLKDDIKFEVIRHSKGSSDGRNITNEVVNSAINRMWSKEEIKILKKEFGKHILKDLHEKFLPNKSQGQIRNKAS